MSKMFDYGNVGNLYDKASKWEPLSHHSKQDYAIKFIFGEIDAARRKLSSNKKDIIIQNRLSMLKQLAKTVSSLPIPPPISNDRVRNGCELFGVLNNNKENTCGECETVEVK